jgi:hypothetical protein
MPRLTYGSKEWKEAVRKSKEPLFNFGKPRETGQPTTDYFQQLPPDSSFDQHLDVIEAMSKLVAFHEQVPSEITIHIPVTKPILFVSTADWQLGQFGVDYRQFRQDVRTWADEPSIGLHIGGDGYQNIIQASKIGSSMNQIPVDVQRGLYVQTLKILVDNIWTIGTGNHNMWSTLATGEDWDAELAKRLHLIYIKHYALVHLWVGKQEYPYLVLHKGRFSSSFNLTHTCKQYQRLYFPQARIVIVEHQHTAAIEQYRYDGQECLAMRPGTYATYDDFAQANGFFGSHVCNPCVVLYPNEDKMIGFKDYKDGLTYLKAVRKK